MTVDTLEDRVIDHVQQLQGELRRSFQARMRSLAESGANSYADEDHAWTSFLIRACEAELKSDGLSDDQQKLLKTILRESRQLLKQR